MSFQFCLSVCTTEPQTCGTTAEELSVFFCISFSDTGDSIGYIEQIKAMLTQKPYHKKNDYNVKTLQTYITNHFFESVRFFDTIYELLIHFNASNERSKLISCSP